jgi:hypothetical protein
MPEDQTDQDKFDAIQRRLTNSPLPRMEVAIATPKLP